MVSRTTRFVAGATRWTSDGGSLFAMFIMPFGNITWKEHIELVREKVIRLNQREASKEPPSSSLEDAKE